MKVITDEKFIPAKMVTEYKYVAENGAIFNSKEQCERYEDFLKMRQLPVFKSKIDMVLYCVEDIDDYVLGLYYINSQDDYDYLLKIQNINEYHVVENDFHSSAPGWYVVIQDDDYYPRFKIRSLADYMKCLEENYNKWKADIFEKIEEKERECAK